MPYALRRFFCVILVNNSPADPKALWLNFIDDLSSDLLKETRGNVVRAYQLTLQNIDSILHSMSHTVDEYKLVPFKVGLTHEEMFTREYLNELNSVVSEDDLNCVPLLNSKQRLFFDDIMQNVRSDAGRAFFVDGPGGTGKTFLYMALLATVWSTGVIALAVASLGVAASLLPNGRTAHSRFKLPLKLDETLSCGIKKNTREASLIIAAKLIIWDEASMANRRHFEALDLLLQDLMGVWKLFGGKTLVFGGNFRQTIPIVAKGSREACINACLVNSFLWQHIKKLRLTKNMRAREDPNFVDFLLRVGNDTEANVRSDYIKLPPKMCLPYQSNSQPLEALVTNIFPTFDVYKEAPSSAINSAILTAKNDCMESINDVLIDKFPGQIKEYVSSNLTNDPKQQGFYQDYLNSIDVGALPPHVLKLKPNCPVMLMRNINPTEGMCNDTRLIVRDAGERMIRATIASGEMTGKDVLTINKAQGQTLDRVGIYLPSPVFAHGQLYVALSRVRKSSAVRILIKPPVANMELSIETRNVVFQEILNAAVLI